MNKYDWNNKDKFLDDWSKSKSKCDFLKKQNLTATSGNYVSLNKWLNFHTNEIPKYSTLNYDAIFIRNSTCNRHQIKRIIKEKKLLKYECNVCKNNGIWQGSCLTLQLEHKNGINNDNRLENLEYLCPNCHTQTKSYGGKNVRNKIFEARFITLQNKNISMDYVNELSDLWKTNILNVRKWFTLHKEELLNKGLVIESSIFIISSNKKNIKKNTVISLHIMRKNRLDDVDTYKNDKNIKQILSVKWKISRHAVKSWLKKNIKDINTLVTPENELKIEPIIKPDLSSRFEQVSVLTNKKQVPKLAKNWGLSDTGAKKWIKNNMPEKFKEIYDPQLLERNQKISARQKEIDYFKSLTIEHFDLEKELTHLKLPKPSFYAEIKRHNPVLYEHLMPTVKCIHCQRKTRTAGLSKTGKQVYRCLEKQCDKSFVL